MPFSLSFYTSVPRGVLGTMLQTNIPGTAVMSSVTSSEIDTNIKGEVDTERQKVQQILVPYNTVVQNNNAESRATTSASNADRPLDQNMFHCSNKMNYLSSFLRQ